MSDLSLWSVIGNDGNAPDGDWIGHLWYNRREAELVARDYNKDAKRCPGRDSTAPYKAVAVRVVPAETNTDAKLDDAMSALRAIADPWMTGEQAQRIAISVIFKYA